LILIFSIDTHHPKTGILCEQILYAFLKKTKIIYTKMLRFLSLSLCVLTLSFGLLQAQQISGRITDGQTQEPLVGVSVRLAGSTTGTVTDAKGYFNLPHQETTATLEVRYIGYETMTLNWREGQNLQVNLKPDYLNLNEITVVGYDANQTLLKTPGSLGLVTERDIARADKTSLSQLMNHIPGVQARGSNTLRPATISIRGMGARGPGGSGRIKIYLNDLMLTNPDGSNAWEDIDPYTIGRMEVIKGPASSIYGASIGGVININTQSAPFQERSVETFGMVGSFDTYRYGATARFSNESTNLMLTYGTQATQGFREFSPEERNFLTFLGTFTASERQTLTLFVNRNRYASRAPGALTAEQAAENPRQALASQVMFNAGRDITFTRLGLSSEYRLAPRWSNTTSITGSFSDLDHPVARIYIYNWIQNFGGRTRFRYDGNLGAMPMRLTFGAEAQVGVNRLNFYGNASGRPNAVAIGDRVSNTRNVVTFAQAEIDLTERLLLSLGASANFYLYRYTEFTRPSPEEQVREFDPFYAPRLGLNYRINERHALHANVSRGFTPPAVGDINQPDGTVNIGLNPETAWSFELGARGSWLNGRLSYDIAAFRMDLNNEILQRTPAVGFTIRENAGSTRYNGFEGLVSWNIVQAPEQWLSLARVYASYTYLDAQFVEFVENPAVGVEVSANGNTVPGNAPHRLFSGMELNTRPGFYAYATYEWVDTTPINNLNTLSNPSFGLLGAKIGWTRTLGQFVLDVHVGGNNLTDEIYSDSPALNPNAIAQGPLAGQVPFLNLNWGRNYYTGLSLKYKF
jgi:iron complex outermembrane receptor protein